MKLVKSPEISEISMKPNDFEISYTIFWSVGPFGASRSRKLTQRTRKTPTVSGLFNGSTKIAGVYETDFTLVARKDLNQYIW